MSQQNTKVKLGKDGPDKNYAVPQAMPNRTSAVDIALSNNSCIASFKFQMGDKASQMSMNLRLTTLNKRMPTTKASGSRSYLMERELFNTETAHITRVISSKETLMIRTHSLFCPMEQFSKATLPTAKSMGKALSS